MYYYSLKFRCDHTHTRPVTSRKKHRLPASTDLNTTERDRASVEPRYKPIFERINRMVLGSTRVTNRFSSEFAAWCWGRPALRTDFRANSPHGVGVDPRYKPIFERINRMVLGEGATGENTPTFWTTQRGRVTSSVVDSFSSRPQGRRISSGHIWLRNLVRNEM